MRLQFLASLLAVLGCSAVSALGQGATLTVEDRLRALEQRLDAVTRENLELRRQLGVADKPASSPVLVTPAGKEARLALGGLAQAQAEFGGADDPRFAGVKDRLYLRRARIYALGSFTENVEFKVECDFTANSLSPSTGVRAQANEIYIGWNRYPAASLRFGNLKPAYCWECLQSDLVIPGIERSLPSDRLGDPRQVALSLGGVLLDKHLGYLVVVGNGTGIASNSNDNSKFHQSARVYAVPFEGKLAGRDARVMLGASLLRTEDSGVGKTGFGFDSVPGGSVDNLFFGKRRGWSTDLNLAYGPAALEAEYLTMHFEPTNRLPKEAFNAEGWHLNLSCFVWQKQVQLLVQRASFDPSTAASAGFNEVETWMLGANWYLRGEDLKLMLQYLFRDQSSSVNDSGRLLARFQVLF